MPTGYTAELMENGQTFKDFVLGCARAFGALITMRDEPNNAEIPEQFTPSDYHVKKLSEANAKLNTLNAMNNDEKISYGEQKRNEATKRYNDLVNEEELQNARLLAMREKVEEWTPPTNDHVGLKDFMLQQINLCIHDTGYFRNEVKLAQDKSPMEYHAEDILGAIRDIEYHTKENIEEVKRTNSRNEWVQQLRNSID